MKYKLFIDESGDHSLSTVDANFPIFALLGLLIEEENYQKISEEITVFKNKYFKSTDVILHSRDIRKCEGAFAILFDLNVKKAFYEDLNSILFNNDYMLVASAILKQKHIEQYGKLADDPYEIAITFLLERMLFELDSRKNQEITEVTIEGRGKKEDQQLAKRYNELLYKGSNEVKPLRFRTKFSEELVFKKKKENDIGLQLADLCAYPLARYVLYPTEPYPSFEIIKPKIRNNNGTIKGYGIKIFP